MDHFAKSKRSFDVYIRNARGSQFVELEYRIQCEIRNKPGYMLAGFLFA